MKETIHRFGEAGHLTGTRVDPETPRADRVAALLFNAGVISRMGPHRFNVKVSRHLARLGLPSLRFDLSGQGDSDVAPQARPSREQAMHDLAAAMDHLQATAGIERFVVIGICSGANIGWSVGAVDPRVIGLYMIDPYAYRTRWTRLRYHVGRCRDRSIPGSVAVLLRSLAPRRARPAENSAGGDMEGLLPVEEYARLMQRMVDRGVSVRIVYTATWSRYYSYPSQFLDVFGDHPFASRIDVRFAPHLDHTMTLLSAQGDVIARIARWLEKLPIWQPAVALRDDDEEELPHGQKQGARGALVPETPLLPSDADAN